MPREILTYSEMSPFIKNGISSVAVEAEGAHTETLYAINKPSDLHICDDCSQPGRFMRVTKDHDSQYFIQITCEDHSPENYFDLELKRGE